MTFPKLGFYKCADDNKIYEVLGIANSFSEADNTQGNLVILKSKSGEVSTVTLGMFNTGISKDGRYWEWNHHVQSLRGPLTKRFIKTYLKPGI